MSTQEARAKIARQVEEHDGKAYGTTFNGVDDVPLGAGHRPRYGHCTCGLREGLQREPRLHKPGDGGAAYWKDDFCGKPMKTRDGKVDERYYEALDRR